MNVLTSCYKISEPPKKLLPKVTSPITPINLISHCQTFFALYHPTKTVINGAVKQRPAGNGAHGLFQKCPAVRGHDVHVETGAEGTGRISQMPRSSSANVCKMQSQLPKDQYDQYLQFAAKAGACLYSERGGIPFPWNPEAEEIQMQVSRAFSDYPEAVSNFRQFVRYGHEALARQSS